MLDSAELAYFNTPLIGVVCSPTTHLLAKPPAGLAALVLPSRSRTMVFSNSFVQADDVSLRICLCTILTIIVSEQLG